MGGMLISVEEVSVWEQWDSDEEKLSLFIGSITFCWIILSKTSSFYLFIPSFFKMDDKQNCWTLWYYSPFKRTRYFRRTNNSDTAKSGDFLFALNLNEKSCLFEMMPPARWCSWIYLVTDVCWRFWVDVTLCKYKKLWIENGKLTGRITEIVFWSTLF